MLGGDSAAAAAEAMALVPDPRAGHFYDGEHRAAQAVARSLGMHGPAAWDIYLFYAPHARWQGGTPPPPVAWYHQLSAPWDPSHQRCGDELTRALAETARALLR
jgi:hypothetical protein